MTAPTLTTTRTGCGFCGEPDHQTPACLILAAFNEEVAAMAQRCPRCRSVMTAPERCATCGRHSDA